MRRGTNEFKQCIGGAYGLGDQWEGEQWDGGPVRWGTNESGGPMRWETNGMGGGCVLIGGPMRWGTNEMGDQWDGGPVRWGANDMGDQWCAHNHGHWCSGGSWQLDCLIQSGIIGNIIAPHYWPFVTSDQWIPLTKGLWYGTCVHNRYDFLHSFDMDIITHVISSWEHRHTVHTIF